MSEQKDLETLREELDYIDNQIMEKVSQRYEIIRKIAEYKKANDLPMMQPQRVDFVLKKAKKFAGKYDLDEIFLTNMYRLIIDYACKLEDIIIEEE